MPESMRARITGTVGGSDETYTETIEVEGDSIERASPSVPAAKTGTLTTRTDANTGTLTMSSGHGFTDGQKVDVFWTGGQRRNMTVGTVATNSVPIDGGSGDDLPANNTAITAMVPTSVPFDADGDTVVGITCKTPKAGWIVFVDDSNADIADATFRFDEAGGHTWVDGIGYANPLAGVIVSAVKFSHADSAAAQTMKAACVLN